MTPAQFLANISSRAKIINMMTEKHRIYHNLSHAMELGWLAFGDRGLLKNSIEDLMFYYYCAFYHDIIYVPGNKDNEIKSAQEFVNDIFDLGIDTSFKEEHALCRDVELAIQYSANHFHPSAYKANDRVSQFLDFDLWGLGASWPEYMINNKKIKLEFNVQEEFWVRGRIDWINTALKAPRIYRGLDFKTLDREKQAFLNLKRELKELENEM